ncbi:MAG: NAD-dependent epimerase/dehydratase family protein [Candidatus Thermoplasmatota archaeon]|nr:NAD-dependent epimerase/dehydratase family protein [Candidatus Thermoplasmatota archaeon]
MNGKHVLITGGAGFIGSNMVEKLSESNRLTVVDNLSNVDDRYILKYRNLKGFRFINADISSLPEMDDLNDVDVVIHLAANSDVRNGSNGPEVDFKNNVVGTFSLLEYMRKNDVKEILFASSSTVYGEASKLPTPEDYGPYMPISSYGASKMAGEGFITAYSHYYGIRGTIFRFANIVGKNSTHGVIFDFIKKLQKNSKELEILGDGTQKKSYMHVSDCVSSMIFVHERMQKTEIVNLGNREMTSVTTIAQKVVEKMGLHDVKFRYTGGKDGRGWAGDVKIAQLDVSKLFATGWRNSLNSDQAVERAVEETLQQMGWGK